MGYIAADNKADFLAKLVNELESHVPKEQYEPLGAFTQQFFSVTAFEDLARLSKSDVIGSTLSLWRYIRYHDPAQPKITVINPEYEHHGWHSTHTIIQILHQDLPFIVDSVRMTLNQRGSTIHYLQNSVFNHLRDASHHLVLSGKNTTDTVKHKEALLYLEIDRLDSQYELEALQQEITAVLSDVRLVVMDHKAITKRVVALAEQITQWPVGEHDEIEEIKAFLQWLIKDNFTFLGYEELKVEQKGQRKTIKPVKGMTYGLLKSGRLSSQVDCDFYDNESIVSFAKAGERSTVHRPAYPDYISIKQLNEHGDVVGEARILGLYTSPVYHQSPHHIPLLRKKVKQVIARSRIHPKSHHGKELNQVLQVLPREELFQMSFDELYHTALGILQIQERRQIRLFIRQDKNKLFYSCLVYIPRDVYTTRLRIKMQQILEDRLNVQDAEFTTYFSESVLARVHFILRVNPDHEHDYNLQTLTNEIIQVAYSWEDEFRDTLLEAKGEVLGNHLIAQYADGFPAGYCDVFSPRTAVVDIGHLESLSIDEPLEISFYQSIDDVETTLHFKVYHYFQPLPLSDLIPIIENLGLRVVSEHPYKIRKKSGEIFWTHDFTLEYALEQPGNNQQTINFQQVNRIFQEAFREIWFGRAENDGFNRLILGAQLNWRQVAMLRGYARYLKQIRFSLSQPYIESTLIQNIVITKLLVELFNICFNPEFEGTIAHRQQQQQAIEYQIDAALDEVNVLNQDRTLRRYVDVISATLRTNFFQSVDSNSSNTSKQPKAYISFKFDPTRIPEMPLPHPKYEIFVYSPRVEGVHLRGGKVARGGLRWSDRLEDYRTEVLGLVKAQQVKNAVIVPVGAKGGFVPKRLPSGDREAIMSEGIACYQLFIRGLLDLTDNLLANELTKPPQVVCYDDEDSYLVVAADKGTATFSDIANEIAQEYQFWLGDAFASGGSVGYDHKKMGITARGAWVSVQRHFREQGIDVQQETVSVLGIGDMAGDVFGNGMLLSKQIAVVAAFNHQHIFVDPNPDVAASFVERQRLFKLPRSSWMDYDQELVSSGGGIFSRDAKSILISPEMKQRFGIHAPRLTPNELIHALLKSPVDLIWNGGIGTYIKAQRETHNQVGDRANDSLRINGIDLRCRVVGEGGNLGVTQLGRVEFALNKGAINTDFIDNAGGVDCSDHEVNIKILLNSIVANGDMTIKQRNQLLETMTDAVAELVLLNNYRQVQAISLEAWQAQQKIDEYQRFIHHLEAQGKLNRRIEYLPDDDTLAERIAQHQGLTRPELSVLISYSKSDLKNALVSSKVPDDPYLAQEALTAFPAVLAERFGEEIPKHRLHREIVATQLANHLINMMGITFVHRMQLSTGGDAAEIAQAFVIARDVFAVSDYWQQIEALDNHVVAALQLQMMQNLIRLLRRASRWFIRNHRADLSPSICVAHYGPRMREFIEVFPTLLNEETCQRWQTETDELINQGVSDVLAGVVVGFRHVVSGLAIIQAADQTGCPLPLVARVYFAMAERLHLNWFTQELGKLPADNHWQSLARESIRDELYSLQRALTVSVLLTDTSVKETDIEAVDIPALIQRWVDANEVLVKRWDSMLDDLHSQGASELAMFTVANRELTDIARCGLVES